MPKATVDVEEDGAAVEAQAVLDRVALDLAQHRRSGADAALLGPPELHEELGRLVAAAFLALGRRLLAALRLGLGRQERVHLLITAAHDGAG